MPEQLHNQFTQYEQEYSKIKRGRKLTWLDHLGTVDLSIVLADRTLDIEATPAQASILYAFEEIGLFFWGEGADCRLFEFGGVGGEDWVEWGKCEEGGFVLDCEGGC